MREINYQGNTEKWQSKEIQNLHFGEVNMYGKINWKTEVDCEGMSSDIKLSPCLIDEVPRREDIGVEI
jgi:hypothetical protein